MEIEHFSSVIFVIKKKNKSGFRLFGVTQPIVFYNETATGLTDCPSNGSIIDWCNLYRDKKSISNKTDFKTVMPSATYQHFFQIILRFVKGNIVNKDI